MTVPDPGRPDMQSSAMASVARPSLAARSVAPLSRVWLAVVVLSACTVEPSFGAQHEELRVCADGPTVDGIDVSRWQGTIDWDAVAGDGVRFALIRVSHGVLTYDAEYTRNWAEARRVGVLRGTYQFFQPDQDPIAQADLLLSNMGTLEPDDLPPVIDVEAMGGLTGPEVATAVRAWLEHVEAATGRTPIIYSGYYFWRDQVGDPPGFARYPLWIPQYGPVCPLIPDSWARWDFFQTSSTGTIAGISGNVDTDLWNGTFEQLLAFANPTPVCGDGVCGAAETHALCPADCLICEPIPPAGRVVEETEVCFVPGGPSTGWRSVDGTGSGAHVYWTYAVATATENPGTWNLDLTESGLYRVEAYTPAPYAGSAQAPYTIRHAGREDPAILDQTAVDGWQSLGELPFAAGADQWVQLVDSTGEPYADRVMLGFDAVRLTRLSTMPTDGGTPISDGGTSRTDSGTPVGPDGGTPSVLDGSVPGADAGATLRIDGHLDGGCSCGVTAGAGRGAGLWPLLGLMGALGLVRARRRRC